MTTDTENRLGATFDRYLALWDLSQDGEPIFTRSGALLPVRRKGLPAMLKIAREEEERRGGLLMAWWNGEGAPQVLALEGDALLMERVEGRASLAEMARCGRDDEASSIMCRVAAALHAPRNRPAPRLVPLSRWFEALDPAASRHGGILRHAATAARELLDTQRDVAVLHGDIHHGNVLDAGSRGWLAIDPKGLLGERGFDFANIFCNPDHRTAVAPGRLSRQADVVAATAGLERTRLLKWILAYSGLSAAWFLEEDAAPDASLEVAALAAAELASL